MSGQCRGESLLESYKSRRAVAERLQERRGRSSATRAVPRTLRVAALRVTPTSRPVARGVGAMGLGGASRGGAEVS